MAAYNRVRRNEDERCSNCGSQIGRWVQFKYGSVWQYDYEVGDPIRWGANDIGVPGRKTVVASGHPEACPVCENVPDYHFDVRLEKDTIQSVERAADEDEYRRFGHESFRIVEE